MDSGGTMGSYANLRMTTPYMVNKGWKFRMDTPSPWYSDNSSIKVKDLRNAVRIRIYVTLMETMYTKLPREESWFRIA